MIASGVCIGASTITRVDLINDENGIRIIDVFSKVHEGNIKRTFEDMIRDCDSLKEGKIAVTGRKFKNLVTLPSVSEPEAVESAYALLKEKYGEARYISCAGGETFTTYKLDASGKIINILTGNKCASGTGEFFLQQIRRMGISLEEAVQGKEESQVYEVSGRCSVFCKSDCTHALNKGYGKESIILGLCDMMASKILEHLDEDFTEKVWLTGGCSKNGVMVSALKKHLPYLVIPEEASCFEALGCALWALKSPVKPVENPEGLLVEGTKSFSTLPPLSSSFSLVEFGELEKARAVEGDKCILGLDVGSTTTKAVLIRERDNALLTSIYIKTLGDPIGASKNCYKALKKDLDCGVRIIGLGVTGSGRQIAGLYSMSGDVYNEISAHAAAATYFDTEVDTIFEIGGQDAKYTHIIHGVPGDYAMNEACSAGTGSFLEESASEFLNMDMRDIEQAALRGRNIPDFNDQCAAFIGSDIKTAMQENLDRDDIVAGLVYSICKNYLNRVKGNRFVGKKILMQGGVCYNRAVPAAMAALLGKRIVVPPEPGLMGAFGVALMVKEKMRQGITGEKSYDLDRLAAREVKYGKSFTCSGGSTGCDRKCDISIVEVEGGKYPFGGLCGKYGCMQTQNRGSSHHEAVRHGGPLQANLVNLRERMVFDKYSTGLGLGRGDSSGGSRKRIGISRSLLVNTLFPLYYHFFTRLGMEVVLPDKNGLTEKKGVGKEAAFCYPVSLAHEYFKGLVRDCPDYIFLPHVKGMYVENGIPISLTCPLVQGERYYLGAAFEQVDPEKILSPVLDFAAGYEAVGKSFINLGEKLGFGREASAEAYTFAAEAQKLFVSMCKKTGKEFLEEIERAGEKALVLFGRPYNAMVQEGNMGIPEKFASRGFKIIPYDFLPIEEEEPQPKMYWSMGQMILKAAKLVNRHPQLFGVFVTNFSCGPDSFVVGYFREIMGDKPTLTLELDSHTADAGVDTRIDAFIDVMLNYRQGGQYAAAPYGPAAVYDEKERKVRTVSGEYVSLRDPRVKLLLPSMGRIGSLCFAAAFRYAGIGTVLLDEPAEEELQMGRAHSLCKECLPLMLTVGSLLNYLRRHREEDILAYFMPEAPDPCRFGQYHVYTEKLLKKMGINHVALLTLSSGNSYGGLGTKFKLRAWQAVVIADVLDDIYSSILTLAEEREQALAVFDHWTREITAGLERDSWSGLKNILKDAAGALSAIRLKNPPESAKKVALVGEIYVRRDGFSRQHLVEQLASRGIITRVASFTEWMYYCDYLVKNDLSESADFKDKIKVFAESFVRIQIEREIKQIFARSNLFTPHPVDIDEVIASARDLISPHLSGEAILTIGTAINEIVNHVDGVISIGPFGCMPSRIAQAILKEKISTHKKKISEDPIVQALLEKHPNLPFLSIETDGSTFPQLIEVKLEAFALQVARVNELKKILL